MTPDDPPAKRNMQRLASMRPSGNFVLDGLRGAIASQGTPLPQMTPEERAQSKESLETAGTMVAGLTPLDTPVAAATALRDAKRGDWVGAGLNGLGVLPGIPMLGSLRKLDNVAEEVPSVAKYLYHTTHKDNLADIAAQGLKPHRPSFRGEQEYWPSAMGGSGREGRVYLGGSEEGVKPFSEPGHVTLRLPQAIAEKLGLLEEFKGSDYFTRKKIAPDAIEAKINDVWQKLGSLFQP